jgi:hypothetical protein
MHQADFDTIGLHRLAAATLAFAFFGPRRFGALGPL